jgi:hypothetical protein
MGSVISAKKERWWQRTTRLLAAEWAQTTPQIGPKNQTPKAFPPSIFLQDATISSSIREIRKTLKKSKKNLRKIDEKNNKTRVVLAPADKSYSIGHKPLLSGMRPLL